MEASALYADPKEQWDVIRKMMNEEAMRKGEWAGIPIPVDRVRLVLEPRYPFQRLNGAKFENGKMVGADKTVEKAKVINCWDTGKGCTVFIIEEPDGKRWKFFESNSSGKRQLLMLNTLGVSAGATWSIEAEEMALTKLKEMVAPHQYKMYVLGGAFIETSKRSGVKYIFRKLKPTVAICPDKGNPGEQIRVLTTLCMHPIGYYEQSFAGSYVPTDDVCAHLMLMRADERRFWGKCNHHNPRTPQAGI